MLDFNIINALIVLTSILVFVLIIKPYFEKKNFKFYEEVKLGLLIFGYAFRDDKVRDIANTALLIVQQVEKLHLTPEEKHYLAVDEVFGALLEEFNIELPEEAISLLVQVAVSMLPPTNQPK